MHEVVSELPNGESLLAKVPVLDSSLHCSTVEKSNVLLRKKLHNVLRSRPRKYNSDCIRPIREICDEGTEFRIVALV